MIIEHALTESQSDQTTNNEASFISNGYVVLNLFTILLFEMIVRD